MTWSGPMTTESPCWTSAASAGAATDSSNAAHASTTDTRVSKKRIVPFLLYSAINSAVMLQGQRHGCGRGGLMLRYRPPSDERAAGHMLTILLAATCPVRWRIRRSESLFRRCQLAREQTC